jgi:hypothetical protein
MGNAEERNGTLMCTDAYAATFGIKSRGTVSRCLNLLKERGLIVCTRKAVTVGRDMVADLLPRRLAARSSRRSDTRLPDVVAGAGTQAQGKRIGRR